ncbi:N(G),N(G)-dimethylarginine dimethylaminohydrolase 1 [Trichoplax sp. H2]|uniref:Uncharacterized protein n=1 Tax=Trichoplax adhaerens TaxID=10228 RepID=B3RNY6_TRIAD|nr:hypothetical protein TRIADDRAFT_21132 [Trichoplax adhaerens]EDV27542.1 hypothetical protein TRIADDRAFT_21132 [Trichoplax adhaerens]RDD43434.1 N(G),N(G)-dimethylarginine dimethylaminohydrolase 1 [Trichoplax sp. H2]|eukprot:XP_002109376.1 hypothetical protein TRIADDRAFT_21132 [Trichoplax adhaerens]
MSTGPFKCKYALVCESVPDSYASQSLRSREPNDPIDIDLARRQHAEYIKLLKDLVENIITIPCDENYPDCVFVEDTAVVLDGTALICRPGAESRRGEVDAVRQKLAELKLRIVEVEAPGTLDGGDVVFTGKEIFVGISNRTNIAGATAVARAFPDYQVSMIKIKGSLHLKSILTMVDSETLVVVGNEYGKKVIENMQNNCNYIYQKITVPEGGASNCLHVNDNIIHGSPSEIEDVEKFFEIMNKPTYHVENSEFNKADGCLTCRSVLF